MQPELDHIFVCVDRPRRGCDALVNAGFAEGSGGRHRGQGTANARFFFDNAYLEVLWAVDDEELSSDAVQPTCLRERMSWADNGACPFGVAFRGSPPWDPVWKYRAPFLDDGSTIPIHSRPDEPTDPFLFVMSSGRPDASPEQQPLRHLPVGADRYEISSVEIVCPTPPSLPLESLAANGAVYRVGPVLFVHGGRYAMKIVLRSQTGPLHISLDPHLPIDIVG